MTIAELLTRNRSYRRFHEDEPLEEQTLVGLVELTRRCPSSGNQQPLRYLVSCTREQNAKIFPCLRWAGGLKGWPGPVEGERPAGYIVILGDARSPASHNVDSGIAAQSMLLAAVEQGLGGCMVGSIDRDALRAALGIPSQLAIVLVVALGRPKETVVLEDAKHPNDIDYWRDLQDVHHVPKRPLSELLVKF
jgi:nitroreductase